MSRHSSPLVVVFASGPFLPLLDLWLAAGSRLGLRRIRVYALDAATVTWCSDRDVDVVPAPWNGARADLWVLRVGVFRELLAAGEEFIHSDIDAIWIRNPLEQGSARGLDDHLLFSEGTYWPPDIFDLQGFVLCAGWFWARPASQSHDFFAAVANDVRTSGDDQASLNRVLAAAGARWNRVEGDYELPMGERSIRCWHEPIHATLDSSALRVALLPNREFQRLPDPHEGVVVRHPLTSKGCANKLRELRALGLLLPDSAA